jgi:hypothetical protein
MSDADRVWLGRTAATWKMVRSHSLRLPPAKLPWMVVFDRECVYNINPNEKYSPAPGFGYVLKLGNETVSVRSRNHAGTVDLPDGASIPARVISFAANYDSDSRSFFTAALPSVWERDDYLRSEPRLASLVRAVYIHELTHTYHRNFFARLSAIEKTLAGVEKFDDDIVQNQFGRDEAFRDMYLSEIASAQKALLSPSRRDRKVAAKELLQAINDRRAKYYTGNNAKYAEIEDIFLTMEGVANWAGYRAALADGLSDADAQRLIRRSGKFWSQEEGILLFLLIDSLVPGWQKAAFSGENVSIVKLLERAAK